MQGALSDDGDLLRGVLIQGDCTTHVRGQQQQEQARKLVEMMSRFVTRVTMLYLRVSESHYH